MKNLKLFISALLSITVICNQAVAAKSLTIQQRLTNLERQLKQPQDNRTNTADIVLQNQTLQQQIAKLEGVIEEQNHQIKNLKEKQKLLYIDVDSRLAELETRAYVTAPPSNNNEDLSGMQPDTNNNQPLSVEVDSDYNAGSATTQSINNQTDISQPILSTFQDDYDIAFAHLRAGRFVESARAFESFIQNHPNNDLTDNAYYWLGESYYVKRQYPQALAAFQSLTQKFPSSSKAPDSLLKIGYSYYEMDDFVKAEENLQTVIDTYPNTSIARLAKNRLRQLQRDH